MLAPLAASGWVMRHAPALLILTVVAGVAVGVIAVRGPNTVVARVSFVAVTNEPAGAVALFRVTNQSAEILGRNYYRVEGRGFEAHLLTPPPARLPPGAAEILRVPVPEENTGSITVRVYLRKPPDGKLKRRVKRILWKLGRAGNAQRDEPGLVEVSCTASLEDQQTPGSGETGGEPPGGTS